MHIMGASKTIEARQAIRVPLVIQSTHITEVPQVIVTMQILKTTRDVELTHVIECRP